MTGMREDQAASSGWPLWWLFMVLMSLVNFVSALYVSPDPPPISYAEDDEELWEREENYPLKRRVVD